MFKELGEFIDSVPQNFADLIRKTAETSLCPPHEGCLIAPMKNLEDILSRIDETDGVEEVLEIKNDGTIISTNDKNIITID